MTTSTNKDTAAGDNDVDVDVDVAADSLSRLFCFDDDDGSSQVTRLPSHVHDLASCAAHQIQVLEEQLLQLQHNGDLSTAAAAAATTAISLSDLEDALDDGFFLCDLRTVQRKLQIWQQHLFPTVKPYFALKCHPDAKVATVLANTNTRSDGGSSFSCGFDCASMAEIDLALQALQSTQNNRKLNNGNGAIDDTIKYHLMNDNIIYANPQRAEDALAVALRRGIRYLTFDGAEELYKVHRLYHEMVVRQEQNDNNKIQLQPPPPPPPPPQMILRILVPDEHSNVPLGEKFGAPPATWEQLIHVALDELQWPLVGVSFHCGSGNHDPASYTTALQLAEQALDLIMAKTAEKKTQEQQQQQQQPSSSSSLQPQQQQQQQHSYILDMGGGYPGCDGHGGDMHCFAHPSRYNNINDDADDDDNDNVNSASMIDVDHSARAIAQAVNPVLARLSQKYNNNNNNNKKNSGGDNGGAGKSNEARSGVRFVAEPGRYFCEAAFALVCRIYKVVVVEEEEEEEEAASRPRQRHYHYYIAHGVQGVFKDRVLCDEVFTPKALRVASLPSNKQEQEPAEKENASSTLRGVRCTVHGPSGADYDIICTSTTPVWLPQPLAVGDYLLFDRMGAYTKSIASRSGQPPVRYVI